MEINGNMSTGVNVDYKFLLYYHYVDIVDPQELYVQQVQLCKALNLFGRIRISNEGINGTIGGTFCSITEYIRVVDNLPELHPPSAEPIHWKISGLVSRYPPERQILRDLCVKVTKEVVSLDLPPGVREIIATGDGGIHLSPPEFHSALGALASDSSMKESFRLLDIRNHYEVKIGTFEVPTSDGSLIPAINPETRAVLISEQLFLFHDVYRSL